MKEKNVVVLARARTEHYSRWSYGRVLKKNETRILEKKMNLAEQGLKDAQAHYGREFISISDAIEFFHTFKTQEDALPALLLLKCMFLKHGKSFESELMDTCQSIQDAAKVEGLSDKWLQALIDRFNALPGCSDSHPEE